MNATELYKILDKQNFIINGYTCRLIAPEKDFGQTCKNCELIKYGIRYFDPKCGDKEIMDGIINNIKIKMRKEKLEKLLNHD